MGGVVGSWLMMLLCVPVTANPAEGAGRGCRGNVGFEILIRGADRGRGSGVCKEQGLS